MKGADALSDLWSVELSRLLALDEGGGGEEEEEEEEGPDDGRGSPSPFHSHSQLSGWLSGRCGKVPVTLSARTAKVAGTGDEGGGGEEEEWGEMEMERGWKAGGLHLCQNLCHLFPVLVWLLGRCGKVPTPSA